MRPLLSPFPTLLSLEKEIYLTLWVSFVLWGDPINETITEVGLPRSPAQALALYSLCSPFFHVASPSRNLGLNSDREKIFLELCFLSVLQALMNGLFIYLFICHSLFFIILLSQGCRPGLPTKASGSFLFIYFFIHSANIYYTPARPLLGSEDTDGNNTDRRCCPLRACTGAGGDTIVSALGCLTGILDLTSPK